MLLCLTPNSKIARRLAGVLTALALAFHALLPTGYMLSANTKGAGIEITLCTQDGTVAAFMAPDGSISQTKQDDNNRTNHDGSDSTSPCHFALLSGTLVFASPSFIAALPEYEMIRQETDPAVMPAPGQGLAAPPPPKTGPPIQA
jgi:hypothetical protein